MKAIIIHGNGGCTADDIWLPWLESELTTLGIDVINQTFPDNIKGQAAWWLPHLESLGADEHTILIGHSSGAVAAMRYAESHRPLGSILVYVCHAASCALLSGTRGSEVKTTSRRLPRSGRRRRLSSGC